MFGWLRLSHKYYLPNHNRYENIGGVEAKCKEEGAPLDLSIWASQDQFSFFGRPQRANGKRLTFSCQSTALSMRKAVKEIWNIFKMSKKS